MRVLTWNLFHGRAVPPAGHELRTQFTAKLAAWTWDVALLQEVPPWWPPPLAEACDADARSVLTSRNAWPALRRFVAERAPDVIRSHGGGANAILVRRAAGTIAEHREIELRRRPERRVCHAVALAGGGPWIANLHAQAHSAEHAQADIERAAAATLRWAGDAPALLGGDFNVRGPDVPGFAPLGGHGVDHLFGRGLRAAGDPALPDRDGLSDHAAVIVTVLARVPDGSG